MYLTSDPILRAGYLWFILVLKYSVNILVITVQTIELKTIYS